MGDHMIGRGVPEELASRFVLRRCLGQGGFGVVHEAQDRALGTDVALKELLIVDPAALYSFKQEFRALADVTHPNLVGLQELFSVGGRWYLTMDLVRGENFLRHVRPWPASEPASDPDTLDSQLVDVDTGDETGLLFHSGVVSLPVTRTSAFAQTMTLGAMQTATPRSLQPAPAPAMPPVRGVLDVGRLRAALLQLAEGVDAIHRTGRMHRDIKPSNVLVTHAGRVVILDFGLVGSFSSTSNPGMAMGTPVYMAPEQITSVLITAAADWYAVGVMLYEALTGRVPHVTPGISMMELLLLKPQQDPPSPRSIAPELPEDLSALCMRLLDRDPATRASAAEVRRVLAAEGPASATAAAGPARAVFVGRAGELAALREAHATARARATVVVHVHGTSGMGKSDLLRHFLDGLQQVDASLLLVEGRCHEREWVPYKAFDGVVDAIARWLDELPRQEIGRLVPNGLGALVRLFPVLGRIEAAGAEQDQHEVPDPHELRRRAFAALRALLTNIGRRHTLVLHIDDVQWADADSAALLDALLAPPAPPPCLLLASYRSEEAGASAFIATLPSRTRPLAGVETREIVVGPLSTTDAAALARTILGGDDDADRRRADRIAREAGGSPFFVQELARHAASAPSDEGIALGEVVGARVAALAPDVRNLLELVSTAGKPVGPAVLKRAAGLDDEREQEAIALLRAGCLVRARGRGDEARLEPYHDKIRETVVAGLAQPTLRAHHLSLALAMEATGAADPEALAMHLQSAGEPARARIYLEQAAQRAERALAFDRAATLYRSALALAAPPDQPAIELRLADALTKAGRGAQAAQAFLHAAARVGPAQALMARRRAVEQMLRAGQIDEGLDVARVLLPQVGMQLTKTPRHALMSMLASRLKLRLRGLQFVERSEAQQDQQKLHRIDLCWSLGNGLGGVDMIRGADFQARHLLLSLESGEPYRISRAFSWEAVLRSLEGSPASLAQSQDLSARAEVIARRIQHPHAIAWVAAAKGVAAHNGQRFRDAALLCDRAITLFREACTDIAWEIASMSAWWHLSALFFVGDLATLHRRLPASLTEADTLGDHYMKTALGVYTHPLSLTFAGRPDDALATIDRALGDWKARGFHSMHNMALYSRTNTLLYLGQGRRALEHVLADWKPLEASYLLRSKASRIRCHDARARCVLATAGEGRSAEPALREVLDWADRLEKERTPWSDGHAFALRAAVQLRRGGPDKARALYRRAQAAFLLRDMELFAHAAERQIAALEHDSASLARVDAWMTSRGIADPQRSAATLIPR
jgi:serine/threonine protein kinase/tetratricopeptide (TPR) repeat protein